jgi:hypothetical protein
MRRNIVITLGIVVTVSVLFVLVWVMSGGESQTPPASKVSETTTEPVAESLETIAGNDNVSGAKYFANNTWLVGAASSTTDDVGETYTIVSKLSDGEWTTVDVGSFIDTESLLFEGAPPDLISYLEEIQ